MGEDPTGTRRPGSRPRWEMVRHPVRWLRGWPLWGLPSRVLAYVLGVEMIALTAALYTGLLYSVETSDLTLATILAACAVAHIEATRTIERQREITAGVGPYLDLKSVWNFAALLLLPPSLATGMVVVTYTYAWFRIWPTDRGLACYRWVFSGATVVLATQVAVAVLAFAATPYPGLPTGLHGIALIAASGAVRWLINYALVLLVLALSQPETTAKELVSNIRDQYLEAGMVGLAWATAALLVHQPLALIGVVVALITLQQTVLIGQLRRQSQIDDKTGLYIWGFWKQQAEQILTRAQYRDATGALLISDLDHFKRINDTYGHPAGDTVLAAVAEVISDEVRDGFDLVGRYGGEEFIVLLPDINEAELTQTANRLRRRVERLVVDVTTPDGLKEIRVTVSIGVARYPANGTTLDDLKDAADFALLAAKNEGRNRVLLAPPDPAPSEPPGTDHQTNAAPTAPGAPAPPRRQEH